MVSRLVHSAFLPSYKENMFKQTPDKRFFLFIAFLNSIYMCKAFADGGPLGLVTTDAMIDHFDNVALLGGVAFALTVVTEYLVTYLCLRRPRKAAARLFLWVLAVNVATNPTFQAGTYFLEDILELFAVPPNSTPGQLSLIFGFELIVVTVESIILNWVFGRFHHEGIIEGPVAARRTVTIVILSNMASFIFVIMTFCAVIEISRLGNDYLFKPIY